MKKFLIIPNPLKPGTAGYGAQLASLLAAKGQEPCMLAEHAAFCGAVCRVLEPEEVAAVDAAIILGGDGTVLTSMHRYGLLDVPFFGVNFGHLGYLTECDPQDTEAYIDAVLEDRCTLEERIVLEGTLCSGDEKTNFVGINEAVIHRAALNRALRFSISVNGNIIHNFAGDGILVATPTGSTAYNISAGGPVLMPASDCFVITPICSQYRSSCPLVVSAEDVIEISIRELPHFIPGSDSPPVMDVDSFARLTVQPGSSVTFRKAEQKVRMLKLSSESFYVALKKKLSSNGG